MDMSTSDIIVASVFIVFTIAEIAVLFFASEFASPRDPRKDSDVQPLRLSDDAKDTASRDKKTERTT